eukprot:RCo042277
MAAPVKLFVGQIPSAADEQQVKAVFEAFGKVAEVYVMRDKATGISKGAAFVTFHSREEADLAIATLHDRHTMPPQTRPLQVRYANPPSAGAAPSAPGLGAGLVPNAGALVALQGYGAPALTAASGAMRVPKGGRKLFVGQIPRATTQEELLAVMQEFGTVEEIYLMKDKTTGEGKGAAFVTYSSPLEAYAAIEGLDKKRVMPPMRNSMQVSLADGEMPGSVAGAMAGSLAALGGSGRETKLFVGMLPFSVTETELQALFAPFGQLIEVVVLRKNGQSTGSGFVKYSTTAECDAAILALNGVSMDGSARRLAVRYADAKKEVG